MLYTTVKHWPLTGPKERKSLNNTLEFSGVVGKCARCVSACDDWATHEKRAFQQESGRLRPDQLRFRPQRCEFFHLCKWPHPWKSLPFSRVVREFGRFRHLALTAAVCCLSLPCMKRSMSEADGDGGRPLCTMWFWLRTPDDPSGGAKQKNDLMRVMLMRVMGEKMKHPTWAVQIWVAQLPNDMLLKW